MNEYISKLKQQPISAYVLSETLAEIGAIISSLGTLNTTDLSSATASQLDTFGGPYWHVNLPSLSHPKCIIPNTTDSHMTAIFTSTTLLCWIPCLLSSFPSSVVDNNSILSLLPFSNCIHQRWIVGYFRIVDCLV